MKVPCIHCKHSFSVKAEKPGRFKLKCPACGELLGISVDAGPPLKLSVFPVAERPVAAPNVSEGTLDSAVNPPRPATKPAQHTQATKHTQPNSFEATSDSAVNPPRTATKAPQQSQANSFEATSDSAVNPPRVATKVPQHSQANSFEATCDSIVDSKATVAKSAASRPTKPDLEATQDPSITHSSKPSVNQAAMDQTSAGISSAGQTAGVRSSVRVGTKADATPVGNSSNRSVVRAGPGMVATPANKSSQVNSAPGKQVASANSSAKKVAVEESIPERLGGYRILKLLGKGAMGAVYQARQISLDRNVALKVVRAQWADSPAALVRFTREAYAAAQLTHHNVVQIYDFGQDAGQHYFSMEWIRGGPLSDVIQERGALDARIAAGYILQAARGLQFAHRQGMVHRDIKPANLLLDEEGIVKVADLGLVKVPDQPDPESGVGKAERVSGHASGSQVTMAGSSVGTPAFMAPEQTVDAAMVDHRADIYSLGCSLFYLLCGKPPFAGRDLAHLFQQHRQEPPPALSKFNVNAPPQLEAIIQRSLAKRPEDRYANISEMIAELEAFLGLQSGAAPSLTKDQVLAIEQSVNAYNAVPLAKLRTPILGIGGLLSLILSVALLFVAPGWAIFPGLAFIVSVASYLLFAGTGGGSPLASSIRAALFASRWTDWLTWSFGLLAITGGLILAGFGGGVITALIVGIAIGASFHFGLQRVLHGSRQPHRISLEHALRELRLAGASEEAVRYQFARFSGKHWEEPFAELFGYSAMRDSRDALIRGNEHAGRAKFWPWRDWIIDRCQSRVKTAHDAKQQSALAKVEHAGLRAEGLSAVEANERAWQMAAALMDAAKQVSVASGGNEQIEAAAKRARMRAMLADARSGNYQRKRTNPMILALKFLLGGKLRFLLGCALLAGFALWMRANGIIGGDTLTQIAADTDRAALNEMARGVGSKLLSGGQPVLGGLVNGLATVAVACVLMMSSISGSWRMSIFAYGAAIVGLFGSSLGIPSIPPLSAEILSAIAAIAAFTPGIFFGGDTAD